MSGVDERLVYAVALGATIAQRRQGRMTQRALALDAGLSQSALSRFETGQTMPDAYELHRLALALEVTVAQLVAPAARRVQR